MEDDVAVGPATWLFDETGVTDASPNGNNPYYRNNVPSPLIIPLFGASNVGTYRCESHGSTSASGDSITLVLSSMYLCVTT